MLSTVEAELGAQFLNVKAAIPISITPNEMGQKLSNMHPNRQLNGAWCRHEQN